MVETHRRVKKKCPEVISISCTHNIQTKQKNSPPALILLSLVSFSNDFSRPALLQATSCAAMLLFLLLVLRLILLLLKPIEKWMNWLFPLARARLLPSLARERTFHTKLNLKLVRLKWNNDDKDQSVCGWKKREEKVWISTLWLRSLVWSKKSDRKVFSIPLEGEGAWNSHIYANFWITEWLNEMWY